jgi:hypothetical protein
MNGNETDALPLNKREKSFLKMKMKNLNIFEKVFELLGKML